MRLRIIDLNTPWFWLVAFSQYAYGEPRFNLNVYGPQRWQRFWFHFWQRETLPEQTAGLGYVSVPQQDTE